jgi:hypothetical protein
VSLISEFEDELSAMETGLRRAARLTAGAETGAGDVAGRMARSGFVGIARAVGEVRTAIAELGARIAGIDAAVVAARDPAAAVSKQETPEGSLAVLRHIETALQQVRQQISATITRVAETGQLATVVLRGGQPGMLLAALNAIRAALTVVGQHAIAARERVAEAVAVAGEAGMTDATDAGPPADDAEPGAVVRDSRGRVVPPGVKRLPSGRYPSNFEWAGRVYAGSRWTPGLAAKYPSGVRFTEDGFPDFEPYAIAKATIDPSFAGNHSTDFTEANRQANIQRVPDGYTWHHHQDARTLLLVPIDVHEAVRHAGGVSIMRGRSTDGS